MYLNIQRVELASVRTSEALSEVDLRESIERLKEGRAPGGPCLLTEAALRATFISELREAAC
eukprot:7789725-Alexandrium_andersonii.AAC.1